MPMKLLACISLPPASIKSVPIYDFATANEGLAGVDMRFYFSCCGKSICKGCAWSFTQSGNAENCPFCKAENEKTDEKRIEQLMNRVEANDAVAMHMLANHYYAAERGLMQDQERAMELLTQAAKLGRSSAHNQLGHEYHEGGDLKKAKFHFEAAAMAGHEEARYNLGCFEANAGNREQALKHFRIAASSGEYKAMHTLQMIFEGGGLSKYEIDSVLEAYNNSCAEMRSEKRDYFIETHDAIRAELGVSTRV
jgi:tetratricopeptide (TPR) repeat protein